MAERLADAVIYLTTDDTKLRQGFDQAETQAKGFGGAVGGILKTGLAVGAGVAVGAIGGLAFAFRDSIGLAKEQIEVEKQLDAVLASTQGAAGLTATEIKNMASELQSVTNFGDEAILSGQNLLLTFTNIGKDVFPTATETMLNMSAAMGQDMKSSAIQLGKALNDPIAGVGALSRVGVQFTEAQKEQIAAMVEAGDVAGAQTVILKELETQFGGSARAIADPAIQLQNAWGDLKEEVGNAVIPLLNELAKQALPLVIDGIKWFGEKGVPAMTQFGNKVKQVVEAVMNIFQGFRRTLDNDVTGRFAYLKQWADENFPRLQQLVESVVTAMTTFWQNHGQTIMTMVTTTFQTISIVIDTTLKTILGLVQFVLQVLTGDWQGAGQTLIEIVQNIWNGIADIFRVQIDMIRAIFGDFDWGEIGRGMMDGIANGIRDGASRIEDAAESAARNALDAAKRWLGIGSPSRVAAAEIGVPFAQGIGVGLEDEIGRMQRNFSGAMSGMMQSFAGATPAGAGPISITVNVNGGGGYEAGRSTGRGILDELRARGLR